MNQISTDIFPKPPLFFANYNAKEHIIINQGGTSSGKTYTLIDMFFVIAMEAPNQIITVVGQDIPNLKVGAYRDAKEIWGNSSIYQKWFARPNETDRLFTCLNGSKIEFKSYSDEQDAKSGKRDYLFINEANGVPYPIYWQLEARTKKKVYLDYNPSARFYVHDLLIGQPDVKLIISDHRHNPFLSEDMHARIESFTGERFKVYSRGMTGKLDGLIYSNWGLVDSMPETYKSRWIGLDFGFTNDPTAIIDVRLSNGELWLDEIEYKTGLTNPHISKILLDNNIDYYTCVVADSSEPKSIAELQSMRHRVEGAIKGKDSINIGIDVLKRYKLNVTRKSKGLRTELGAYEWAKDRLGKSTNTPIDEFNHALDAVRYVALNKLTDKPKSRGVNSASFKL